MNNIEQQINNIPKDCLKRRIKIRKIIQQQLKNINIDNITILSKYISFYNYNGLIIPILNYLFEHNINNDIIYDKIYDIYVISCTFNDIYTLQNLMLYCFKYNYKFDIHNYNDYAYFQACLTGNINVLYYLKIINNRHYNMKWKFNQQLIIFRHINNIYYINKFCKSLKCFIHKKQIQRLNCYVFNNNIDNINNFYYKIFDGSYISYMLCLNI